MRPIGRIFAAAAVGSMALGLAACSTSSDSSAPAADTKTGDSSGASKVDTSGNTQDWEKAAVKGDGTKTIYLVSKGFQHRFWQAVKEGAEQAGEELGYQVKFVGPQDETKVTEQTDQLKSALDSGPAAIGFAALDSKAAADLLTEIHDKGIPVVAFDSGVESDIPVTTVQTDNKAAAAEAAKHMIELLKGKKGSVGMVCHDSTSTTGKQRCEGFKEYFKANAPADLKLLEAAAALQQTALILGSPHIRCWFDEALLARTQSDMLQIQDAVLAKLQRLNTHALEALQASEEHGEGGDAA